MITTNRFVLSFDIIRFYSFFLLLGLQHVQFMLQHLCVQPPCSARFFYLFRTAVAFGTGRLHPLWLFDAASAIAAALKLLYFVLLLFKFDLEACFAFWESSGSLMLIHAYRCTARSFKSFKIVFTENNSCWSVKHIFFSAEIFVRCDSAVSVHC